MVYLGLSVGSRRRVVKPLRVPCRRGDDNTAKATVAQLVSELGFEVLDAGGLKSARILEPFAMVWINQALFRGLGRNWAYGILRPKN